MKVQWVDHMSLSDVQIYLC
uniref:Uncharacterized protein n=1 Tax=Arundo donax TaxID=35708 RepID=A0A0A8YES6_ARUDO